MVYWAIIATPVLAGSDDLDDIDLILTPRLSSSPDMRVNGFAGAGCALLQGISAIYTNAALPHAYSSANQVSHIVIEGGYSRDRIYTEHIIPAGLSCLLGEQSGTVGLLYRYLRREENRFQHEATLNYSSRLFQKSADHGAVDYGFNIRYERAQWRIKSVDSIPIVTRLRNGAPFSAGPDTGWARFDGEGMSGDHRLLFDLGFYQAYLADRLDFGLTFTNLFGYVWRHRRPYLRAAADSIPGDTLIFRDSVYFADQAQRSEDWIDAAHRCLAVGIVFKTPILGDKAQILIPADVEFLGLNFFQRETTTRLTFRTGLEVFFLQHYALRFGFARAPRSAILRELQTKTKKVNTNIFTGGGGVQVAPFSAEFYFGFNEFGVNARITL